MAKPQVLDGFVVREMTDAEYAQHLQDVETVGMQAQAAANRAAAAASGRAKLADLGLTDDEIQALLGV